MKHTPGYWRVTWAGNEPPGLYLLHQAKKATITIEEHNANARLMRAAPELLKAAKAVTVEFENCDDTPAFATLKTAIVEAEEED